MQPLEFLTSKIADFPGYADDDARRRSDELVRSYLGESMADLEERLKGSDGALDRRLGDALIRAGFTNQAAYRKYEAAARTTSELSAMAAADARTIEVADRAASVDASTVSAYLDGVTEVLDRRDATMSGASDSE